MKKITLEKLRNIVHPANDPRYEYELFLYLDILYEAVSIGALKITRRVIPRLPEESPEEKEALDDVDLQHAERESRAIARLLYNKYNRLLGKDYSIVGGLSYELASYGVGIADVALRSKDGVLIAVEVGEVRADKPLKAFFRSGLRELWVYPYQLSKNYYYVFKKGPQPQWKRLEKYLEEQEREWMERIRAVKVF